MLAALAVVIPLGLGGAVSPVMLTEQTMLLAGPDGGRAGARYAAGVVLTTFVIVVAIVLFGRAISLPTEPHLDASLAPSSPIMRSWPGVVRPPSREIADHESNSAQSSSTFARSSPSSRCSFQPLGLL